jgi:hypothetical protein
MHEGQVGQVKQVVDYFHAKEGEELIVIFII